MIRSMTAFARGEMHCEWGALNIELRSVNHRYLETTIRLPDEFRFLEMSLRERIGRKLGRGKIECRLNYSSFTAQTELVINEDLARQVSHASRTIDAMLYNPSSVSSMDILRWPDVLQPFKFEADQLKKQVLELLEQVLDELSVTRGREGEQLKTLIEQRCNSIETAVSGVKKRLPEVMADWRKRLLERLVEVRHELDPARLEQEMILFAHKTDVAEELDRLSTHVTEVKHVLVQDKPVGRRLDFLMQELNREANTLGSKSADTETTRAAVELKVLIEQMREQVQNIE